MDWSKIKPHFWKLEDIDNVGTWVADAHIQHRILVDNPAKLYGFPQAES